MAYIKFTVEFFTEKNGTKFQTTGLAMSDVDYPDKIGDLTKNQAERFITNWETALAALSRHPKDRIISAGILTRREAYRIRAEEPLLMDAILGEEAVELLERK